jgi:hypothetical protein
LTGIRFRSCVSGFGCLQPDISPYAALPGELGRVFFNIGRSKGRGPGRATGYFVFQGGPAVFRGFSWKTAVVYFQKDEDDAGLANDFAEAFRRQGGDSRVVLQLQQSSGDDTKRLLEAPSNIFVFFGGHGCFNKLSRAVAEQRPEVAIICCCMSNSNPVLPRLLHDRCLH